MAKYICSKLTCDNAYTIWNKKEKGGNDLPRKDSQVLVKGGSGVANDRIITAHGVVTEVSDEHLKLLKANCPSFNRHLDKGFIKVLESSPGAKSADDMSKDMPVDKSAPLTDDKLKQEGKEAGKTSSK